ncbi:MAG: metallophosphoesterase [Clostridiales bacterium]|nr:metallophosphoesterase [Clostridiales bacterium]
MLAFLIAPFYIALNIYILIWLIRWLKACHGFFHKKWVHAVIIILYALAAFSMLAGLIDLPTGLHRLAKHVENYWLGFLLYIIFVVAIADLIKVIVKTIYRKKGLDQTRLRSRRTFVVSGAVCMIVIAVIGVYGMVNAGIIRTTDYDITVDKSGGNMDSMKVVLVADLHMGYSIGTDHIANMVKKINTQDPDVVVIAGDIFDNDYDALEDPEKLEKTFRKIKSRYGVYACYGNHDIKEKILAGFTFKSKEKKESDPRMDAFLEAAGIKLLQDDSVLIDDSVYIYGRADSKHPGRGISKRKTPEQIMDSLDSSKPVIVIAHEPDELGELSDAGVDVDLCGHTHDGQMFPGNLTTALVWENSYGYLNKNGMHNIVTSGVGIFGPDMRVGTIAEVCPITIKFNKQQEEEE